MKHVSLALSILLLAFAAVANLPIWRVPSASAQGNSTTANMEVRTSVPRRCVIETTPLDFGTYDPVQANATAPLLAQTNMTVACTKGTSITIGIDNGGNPSGQIRRMAGGATEFLNYELFKDEARTQRWGNLGAETHPGGVAPSREPRAFIVYGRVDGAQDVAQGAFTDTVLVTVNF